MMLGWNVGIAAQCCEQISLHWCNHSPHLMQNRFKSTEFSLDFQSSQFYKCREIQHVSSSCGKAIIISVIFSAEFAKGQQIWNLSLSCAKPMRVKSSITKQPTSQWHLPPTQDAAWSRYMRTDKNNQWKKLSSSLLQNVVMWGVTSRVAQQSQLPTRHTRTVLSSLPVARYWPSALNVTLFTQSVCPWSMSNTITIPMTHHQLTKHSPINL